MSMLNSSLEKFTDELASKAAVPGGGGASALVAALGIALGSMVGELTLGKKKYADVEADILDLNRRAEVLRAELLALIDADAEVFEPLSRAYGIPKDDPERDEIMEAALASASAVPLEIMKGCCAAIDLVADYAVKGSALAISDAGCAAILCKSALQAAALNVYINTKAMKDRQKAESLNKQAQSMLQKYRALALSIYDEVAGRLL